ncbi:MAG: XTP/dITP diphosphatase [Rubrobacteridae bacterium]|nr:XTP/dITP diphosphatase [Rubrobacteridae bacterium]
MIEVIIASKNDGKIREIVEILKPANLKILSYKDLSGWPEVEETGDTFFDNAMLKAKALVEKYGVAAVSDDSGLEVDILNGAPGVYSARYGGEDGNAFKNNEKLMVELSGVPEEKRTARFHCVAILLFPDGRVIRADGTLEGRIGFEKKGADGFGYDPLFIPEGESRTVAEMSLEEKNLISHRAQAFNKLLDEINSIVSSSN